MFEIIFEEISFENPCRCELYENVLNIYIYVYINIYFQSRRNFSTFVSREILPSNFSPVLVTLEVPCKQINELSPTTKLIFVFIRCPISKICLWFIKLQSVLDNMGMK